MVGQFKFMRTPLIVFGSGKVAELPLILKSKGRNALVLTGNSSWSMNPSLEPAFNNLQKAGFLLFMEKIDSEPSPVIIDNITTMYRGHNIDVVLAVGGGSVIDAGKAVSAMLRVDGYVREYLEGIGTRSHPGIKVPFIAVPTTAGTGSEVTSNAVLSETGKEGYKKSLRHENLVPDIALIDPMLTASCSPEVTAASGMDAFSQLLESYLSEKSSKFTDLLAVEGINLLAGNILNAYRDSGNIKAREGMSYAAMLSGFTLANAGLGLTHGFASSIGGLFNIPHGLICGTLMAEVNKLILKKLLKEKNNNNAVKKYALLGGMVSGIHDKDTVESAFEFIRYIENLTEILNLKKLGHYNISESNLMNISEITQAKSNPVKFTQNEMMSILRACL